MSGTAMRIESSDATFDLSGEAFGKAVPVWDGVWVIATRHRPGLSKHMFEVKNRRLVFRLTHQQACRTVLVVVRAVDAAVFVA